MKSHILPFSIITALVIGAAYSAPFGSAPVSEPSPSGDSTSPSLNATNPSGFAGSGSSIGTGQPSVPTTQVQIPSNPVPQTYSPTSSPGVQYQQPPQVLVQNAPASYGQPAVSATTPAGDEGKKWVRDNRGAIYKVSKEAMLPQGWVEIPPPNQPTTAPIPQPAYQQPVMTQPGYQPQYAVPQATTGQQPSVTPGAGMAYPPVPQTQAPPMTNQPSSTMKLIEDQNGYRIMVAKDSPTPPGFREISATEASSMAASPAGAQIPQQQPQLYSPPQAQQVQPAYPNYQPPQTYSSGPSVPNVPPNWQRQLPYQPPVPQFQNPVGPYVNQGIATQQQPVPVIRKPPPGKKRVTDGSGLIYFVDEDTIVGSGMREVTDADLNRPPPFMMQQQQQQQQPSGPGGFLRGLFGR